MKKFIVAAIIVILVSTIASITSAENEIQMKGTVTKIDGNQISVMGAKGKETIVEGVLKGIKVGDSVLIKGQMLKFRPSLTELTSTDIEFLTKQCLIGKADIDVIPQLPNEGREKIFLWIDIGECSKFDSFKAVREYLRKYTPPPSESIFPPRGYQDFLTTAERDYINDVNKRILNKAFEDFSRKMYK